MQQRQYGFIRIASCFSLFYGNIVTNWWLCCQWWFGKLSFFLREKRQLFFYGVIWGSCTVFCGCEAQRTNQCAHWWISLRKGRTNQSADWWISAFYACGSFVCGRDGGRGHTTGSIFPLAEKSPPFCGGGVGSQSRQAANACLLSLCSALAVARARTQ